MAKSALTCKITGVDELIKELQRRGNPTVGNMAARQAVAKGGGIVKREAAANAPRESGLLSKHFKVIVSKPRGVAYGALARIGAMTTAIYPGKPRPWIKGGKPVVRTAASVLTHLELGTGPGTKPFFTQAWERCKAAVQAAIAAKLKEFVDNPDKIR